MKIKPVPQLQRPCVVAASGPSLTKGVAHEVRKARWIHGWTVIAVNDAHKLLPYADILYAADTAWWRSQDLSGFHGERWSCHSQNPGYIDDKTLVYESLDLRLIDARDGKGFSKDPAYIHYGMQPNSGFQAVNIALLTGAPRVVLVGFDMQRVNGDSHFFGEHPPALRRAVDYAGFIQAFPADDRIINATPGSALKCYQRMGLDEALSYEVMNERFYEVSSG